MTSSERRPAVAGMFYPRTAPELGAWVAQMVPGAERRGDWVACVAPHAGYVYSGKVAGRLFGHLEIPRRVVVLGPNHTGFGPPVAVAPHEVWHTPLGPVPVDRQLRELLVEEYPQARLDATAHAREHSIEVQLPFLQHCRPDVTVLPVCLRHLAYADCAALGEALARVVRRAGEPVGLVASSDMSHFEPDEPTRRRDRLAIDAALTMDPKALYDTVEQHGISMCGVVPATVVMAAARPLGATAAHLVAYATSAEASGDTSRVVGYAGICFGPEA